VRQQQALSNANRKVRSLEVEKDEAVCKRDHFEQLFKSLSQEHQRLLAKLQELLALLPQEPENQPAG
jgi:hypothetical protein